MRELTKASTRGTSPLRQATASALLLADAALDVRELGSSWINGTASSIVKFKI
jgi:hypothetical protein